MTRPRRMLAACVLAVVVVPCAVRAQTVPRRLDAPAASPGLLTGAVMHMAIEPLVPGDRDFKWNVDIGGNFDLVDYGRGRVNVLTHYQAVLGREFQRFDPNQGNYTLEAAASWRHGRHEWWGGIRHLSRHLGDRPKDFQVYYHSAAGRYATTREAGAWRLSLNAGGGWVLARRYLDYRGMLDGDVQFARTGSARTQPFGRLALEQVWVLPSATRTARTAWRVEGGTRLSGPRARGELYLGVEQRYDAAILAPSVRRWFIAGLRISSP